MTNLKKMEKMANLAQMEKMVNLEQMANLELIKGDEMHAKNC